MADKVTSHLGGAGIFGVEMFIAQGEVIFSELSPRPHDTGMVTLVSQNLSEFDLHIRAILGLPIPSIELYGPSATYVVLADRYSEAFSYDGLNEAMNIPGVDVRVFGKPTTRPHRRMAVCLARGETLEQAKSDALMASQKIKLVYFD